MDLPAKQTSNLAKLLLVLLLGLASERALVLTHTITSEPNKLADQAAQLVQEVTSANPSAANANQLDEQAGAHLLAPYALAPGAHESPAGGASSISTSYQNQSNMNRLHKHLNERQRRLVERNPGSLGAIARAFKMAIVECRHQMRDEPWDCPVFGFSIKPNEVFGKLVSRSFRETSFIHSLISSALAHSIARACTESTIATCGRKQTRDGFSEDVEFGIAFAREFMEAARDHNGPQGSQSAGSGNLKQLSNNIIASGSSGHSHHAPSADWSSEPSRRERRIRSLINAHNEEVGMFVSIQVLL